MFKPRLFSVHRANAVAQLANPRPQRKKPTTVKLLFLRLISKKSLHQEDAGPLQPWLSSGYCKGVPNASEQISPPETLSVIFEKN